VDVSELVGLIEAEVPAPDVVDLWNGVVVRLDELPGIAAQVPVRLRGSTTEHYAAGVEDSISSAIQLRDGLSTLVEAAGLTAPPRPTNVSTLGVRAFLCPLQPAPSSP
jgi:hypothetical protein